MAEGGVVKARRPCLICGAPGTHAVRIFVPLHPGLAGYVPCDTVLTGQRLCDAHAEPQLAPQWLIEELHAFLCRLYTVYAAALRRRGVPVPPEMAPIETLLDFSQTTLSPRPLDAADVLAAELLRAGYHG